MPQHNNIELLVPAAQNKCEEFTRLCNESLVLQKYNYRVILLETLRDLAVKFAYYMRSRLTARNGDAYSSIGAVQKAFELAGLWKISAAEASVPSTWTLESKHLKGEAFDAMPSKDGINPDWKAPQEVMEEMHRIGLQVGLRCGADFKSKDSPHYELP